MRIRWKILIVLLVITLPPLVFINWFDQQVTRKLGLELAQNRQADLADWGGEMLFLAVRDQGRLLALDRRRIETALELRALRADETPNALVAPGEAEGEAWFDASVGASGAVWTLLRGEGVLRASMAVRGPGNEMTGSEIKGVTYLDLALETLTQGLDLPGEWSEKVVVLVTDRSADGALAVMAHRGLSSGETPDWLESANADDLGYVVDDLRAGKQGQGRMPYRGVDSLWAWGPAGDHALGLVAILPRDLVLAGAAETEERIKKRTDAQLAVTGTAVIVFGLIAIAMSLIGSRTVTGPIKQLTRVAERIADGDLHARADIRTGDEMQELGDSFNEMLPKLQDRIKMREALGLAMEVQQNLLPTDSPDLHGFELAGKIIYCDETGGDYYDFLELSDLDGSRIGIAVGDVSGHGIAAALLMTTARALLRSRASQPGTLSQLMTDINRHLSMDAHRGRFMTFFYGVIEGSSHTFRWVNAGHEPAILYDPASNDFSELGGEDIPLGIDPTWRYTECSKDVWKPGQVVVMGTDGIRESRNPKGEMFGNERLRSVIRAESKAPAADICEAIADAVTTFRAGRGQEDDATVVVIKVTEDFSNEG